MSGLPPIPDHVFAGAACLAAGIVLGMLFSGIVVERAGGTVAGATIGSFSKFPKSDRISSLCGRAS